MHFHFFFLLYVLPPFRNLFFTSTFQIGLSFILRTTQNILTEFTQEFLCGSAGKEYTYNVGDLGLIPVLGRFPGGGKGYPLQYSVLEVPQTL